MSLEGIVVTEIRVLEPDEMAAFVDLAVNAYPAWPVSSVEDKERLCQRLLRMHVDEPTISFYGAFRSGRLVGGMALYDFTMNFRGVRIPAGGVGQVAVDLLHKKQGVAREMMRFFLRHYRQRGAPLALLYPFRPDFYRQMGFGYATKMSQYRVVPAALPCGPSREHVRYLGVDDRQALVDCYHRVASRTHGMIDKSNHEVNRMFANPRHRFVGYERDGLLQGYMVLSFEAGESFIINDIHVWELIVENTTALLELFTFLHTQFDQVRRIVFDTQDDSFHYLLRDPRNGATALIPSVYHESNIQGVGLMIRVCDVAGMIERLREHDLNGQTMTLRLTVDDSFLPENGGDFLLYVRDGRLQSNGSATDEVAVRLAVAEFSAMLIGAVDFRSLYRYGLAEIADPAAVERVERLFALREKPVCTTPF